MGTLFESSSARPGPGGTVVGSPPVAADTGSADSSSAAEGPVETVGEVTCGVYGDVNPTAGAGSRCQATYDEFTEKPR